ncbi:MAG: NfeD family protein [Clostridia bacterium]|nr:NfeD family protein [Clostridia bacterium]
MKEMTLFWLISIIVLFIVEAATVNLMTIWFAFGALAALVTSLLGGKLWLQIVVFIAVTIVTLIPTRKLAKKYFSKSHHQPTNSDMVIGKECIVTEDIDNLVSVGAVKCAGKEWTARSEHGERIAAGETVTAVAIEGVKLIVRPKE